MRISRLNNFISFSVSLLVLIYVHIAATLECSASDRHIQSSKLQYQKYKLVACAIFQNETFFLREWIEYHRIVGVEHFYLYNNLSTDNYLEILQPYIAEGIVELFDWPVETS